MINKWCFPISQDDSQIGISDSGIETFREDMYSSLAREICQNSMDAKLENSYPTKVEFKLTYIDKNLLEDDRSLIEAFKKSKKHGVQLKDGKTIDFFSKGLEVLTKKKIPILRVSDFNTSGLTGSEKRYGSDWVNLIKNSGISQKSGTSGGSYGIGKSAPFACTDTRTLFYSTLDKDGKSAFQGVSRIISFLDEDNKFTTGTGYYGDGTNPIYEQLNLDPDFSREQSGTDLYLIGFKDEENWKDRVIKAVIDGFLLAVYDEKLVVEVEDIVISKQSLDKLINKYKEDKDMEKIYNYYKVLTSEDTLIKKHTIEGLGDIKVLVLVEQGFHKRALISRINGMKIFDMAYISSDIPFAAIVRLVDEDVNAFFRLLEPPAHDKWVPELYDKNKSLASRRVRDIRGAIKKIVEELGEESISAEMDVVGLGEYLPDMEDIFDSKAEEREERKKHSILDLEEIKGDPAKDREKSIDDSPEGETDDDGENEGGNSDGDSDNGNGGRGDDPYGNSGDKKSLKIKMMSVISKRIIYMGENLYRISLNTKEAYKKGYLKFKIVGESSNEDVSILECISDSKIIIDSSKDKINFINNDLETNFDIIFEINYDEACALEVDYYVYSE